MTAGRSDFIPLRWPPQAKTVHVQVTEYFLAYQCSTNNMDWSPAALFDAGNSRCGRTTSDRDSRWAGSRSSTSWGFPLGMQIPPGGGPGYESLLRIEIKASANFGLHGESLEVEIDRPG